MTRDNENVAQKIEKLGKKLASKDTSPEAKRKIAELLKDLEDETETEHDADNAPEYDAVEEQQNEKDETGDDEYTAEYEAEEDAGDAVNEEGKVETEKRRATNSVRLIPFEYPKIANGPYERVLSFNNDEHIRLKNLPDIRGLNEAQIKKKFKEIHDKGPNYWPYFSSRGPLTDLKGIVLRLSRVETTFPVDPLLLSEQEEFPGLQPFPFDQPPVIEKHTTGNGYSKQAYFLNDKDSFVTVGPSLPKIVRIRNGGAQFWVGSIGVIAQGTGIFEGARGVTTYVGSGYLETWPEAFPAQAPILARGFTALIGTFVKVVLKQDVK